MWAVVAATTAGTPAQNDNSECISRLNVQIALQNQQTRKLVSVARERDDVAGR
jgi:hypothetical protein